MTPQTASTWLDWSDEIGLTAARLYLHSMATQTWDEHDDGDWQLADQRAAKYLGQGRRREDECQRETSTSTKINLNHPQAHPPQTILSLSPFLPPHPLLSLSLSLSPTHSFQPKASPVLAASEMIETNFLPDMNAFLWNNNRITLSEHKNSPWVLTDSYSKRTPLFSHFFFLLMRKKGSKMKKRTKEKEIGPRLRDDNVRLVQVQQIFQPSLIIRSDGVQRRSTLP